MLGAALCVGWVDQPVALFFAAHDGARAVFQACAAPSLLALPWAGCVLVYAVWRQWRGLPPVALGWLAVCAATIAATAAKDELKWIFGRPWPETWLKYGAYNFHPLTTSLAYGAFPSGHTSYISAPLCVLWVIAPRWRLAYAAVIFLVMFGLVGANYHFVGDVLGGLLTGMLCAWGSLVLMRAPR
ncbi:MAG TPA: phosphatase PAP2 family protein [Acidocella sp.]|nr:phosphatase PAP2 family protein [Acidocella sp.]